VAKGQCLVGVYDPASRRLDLRSELRYTEASSARAAVLDAYQVGDVVLADVAEVTEKTVGLRLLPGLSVKVERAAVTSNPNDTLRELFTLGEVVLCRIAAAEPLRLRLDDIDEDEVPKPAPGLLPGGPPWLHLAERDRQPVVLAPVAPTVAAPSPADVRTEPPRRLSPLDIARRSPGAVSTPAPLQPLDAESLEKERTRAVNLTNELAAERATRNALSGELAGLRARAAEREAELDGAIRSIEQLQTRYRSADLARQRASRQLKAAQAA
jgi:hypothetical protein